MKALATMRRLARSHRRPAARSSLAMAPVDLVRLVVGDLEQLAQPGCLLAKPEGVEALSKVTARCALCFRSLTRSSSSISRCRTLSAGVTIAIPEFRFNRIAPVTLEKSPVVLAFWRMSQWANKAEKSYDGTSVLYEHALRQFCLAVGRPLRLSEWSGATSNTVTHCGPPH